MSAQFGAATVATTGFSPQASWTVIGGGKPRREQETGLDTLQQIGSTLRFKKNAAIFSEGEPSQYVYKVVSGAVRTCRLLVDGRRQIADFYLADDFFGLDWRDAHHFTAEALGDTVVISYPRKQLEALSEATPMIQRLLMATLFKGLAATQDHVVMLGRQTAYERLAWFLLRVMERTSHSHELDMPMSRLDIADYLGLTIETVSRGISEFKRRRYISATGAHQMRLIEIEALQALASGGAEA
jgi:CRP/FNR family nitrogen fixation transcriptional regulator